MRTTVDLPEDVHRIVSGIAHDTNRSLSATIADLVAREVRGSGAVRLVPDDATGLILLDVGRSTTSEDVRELEDLW
jgi:predicted transcriptional regulator